MCCLFVSVIVSYNDRLDEQIIKTKQKKNLVQCFRRKLLITFSYFSKINAGRKVSINLCYFVDVNKFYSVFFFQRVKDDI